MATLDHIGLNRYIYMSASVDDMTLGSLDVTEITNEHSQSILGANLDDSRLLLGINLYNNGPYGYSSWQQLRMSENPLSRHLRKNNQFPIIGNGRERVYYKGGKRYVVSDKYGTQFLLDEPSVTSNYKPITLIGSVMDYNNAGLNFSLDITKKISMNNNVAYFTNERINKIAGLTEKPDEVYDILKGYYLEEALNSADSPMSSFEKLIFNQTIYPPQQYTYKSYTRARTVFSFNWNSDINQRQQNKVDNFSGLTSNSSSIWPLDVDPNWANFSTPLIEHLGFNGYIDASSDIQKTTSSFGILQNHYSQVAEGLSNIGLNYYNPTFGSQSATPNIFLRPAPLYSRRHALFPSESCVAPTGKTSLATADLTEDTIFGGEAAWDVPRQSGKYPFYDSYAEYSDEMRRKAKDYTVIPEFKMSNHVPKFLSSSAFNTPEDIFDITGSKSDINNSSQDNFYQIYSNSDFLKNFDIVLEDHKDFTDPSKITLKCKAYKKLIPYNGFYPVQRTVNLAEQFYSSYSSFTTVSTASAYSPLFGSATSVTVVHGFQNIMAPLFAPGVLFNSIKSGVAVDYPILTSLEFISQSSDIGYMIQGSGFDKRIPFEALLEPEKHLSDFILVSNEPHPSGNLSSSAFWDGQGDELYSRMANNFIAEIPNFFLKGEQFTTLASSPQNDPNFGQTENNKDVYTMRIKMYRSMDSANASVTSSNASLNTRYVPPQDIIASGREETITMYSRPSAFGPPFAAQAIVADFDADPYLVDGAVIRPDPSKGLNYPFTPPYYHGQAWADITFTPTEKKKYSISEILASSSVEYYRFDTHPFTTTGSTFTDNVMNLDASLNIFTKGTLGEVPENIQDFASVSGLSLDDESLSRWIIQPKFESPILNFNHLDKDESDNVTLPLTSQRRTQLPIGMWHQYGRIPSETEGIYLQVTDIPKNWVEGRLGHGNYNRTGSLADLCGFPQNPVKLGQINNRKKISECVVAIPFIENSGVKEFFKLDQKFVDEAINGESNAEETLVDLVDKMKRFIFPPSFDFVNFPQNVDPIAMYVFEFSVYLSQQDLADIWQNVLPKFGRHHGVEEASISHSLLGNKKLINKSKLREDVRWMVFKVKQRAASRYYDQVFKKKGTKLTDLITEVTADAAGPRSKIQYNWPYDFFSLVELVKIDASVEFSDVETDDNGNETVVPKVATEENARIQLNTLFPKGKK